MVILSHRGPRVQSWAWAAADVDVAERINQRDWIAVVQERRRRVCGGGKALPGLVARRLAEGSLMSA